MITRPRLVEQAGPRLLLDIDNFLRVTYGFNPDILPNEGEISSFSKPAQDIDVTQLDTSLTETLVTPIDLTNVKLSAQANKALANGSIETVGDFLVLSNTTIFESTGMSRPMIERLEDAVKSQTGVSKSDLWRNATAAQAVRWKYAVLKASQIADNQ